MIAAIVVIVGGLGLVALALFWPGQKNPQSGDSSNPFFIGDSLPKRKKRRNPDSADPMGTGGNVGGDSGSGFNS